MRWDAVKERIDAGGGRLLQECVFVLGHGGGGGIAGGVLVGEGEMLEVGDGEGNVYVWGGGEGE